MTAAGGGSSLALWRYAASQEADDEEEEDKGPTAEKLQDVELGEQPVSCFAWSPDKLGLGLCTAFDQRIRTVIVTQLNTL